MKAVSSSIIVLAAAVLVAAGVLTSSGDDWVAIVGLVLGLVGFGGWFREMKASDS